VRNGPQAVGNRRGRGDELKRKPKPVVYIRDPSEYSPPKTREPLPPHVELTPEVIRGLYDQAKKGKQ